MTRSILSAAAFFILLASTADAGSFESIDLRLSVTSNANRETFHELWEPRPGGRIHLETPFYAGRVQLGAHIYKNSASSGTVPSFWTTFLYMGWGFAMSQSRVSWFNGVQAGSAIMDFGERALSQVKAIETELGLGVESRLSVGVATRWSVFLEAEYLHVYTAQSIDLVFVGAGVGRTFGAPRWFRNLFK